MTATSARSYKAIAIAIVIAGVLISASLFVALSGAPKTSTLTTTSTSTLTSTVTETVASSQSESSQGFAPLTTIPLYHESCGIVAETGICNASATPSRVGTLQTFNMTSIVNIGGVNETTIYQHFFGVRLNQSGSLQFSVGDPYGVSFMVHFDSKPGASTGDLSNDVAGDQPRVLVNQSFGIQYFSGQVGEQAAGLYIFTFSVKGPQTGVSVNFIVRDPVTYGNGISMSIGARTDYDANATYAPVTHGLEEWAVTVYSNTTTDVNLSTAMVPLNIWAKFVPSYLPDVGPNGATTTLLIAGAIKPFIPNQFNISVFMDAVGSSGSEGEVFLPVEPVVPVQVLNAPGPINSQIEVNYANVMLTTGQTSTVAYGVVYDPASQAASGSLSVSMRISGILENGVQPLPSWLVVNQPGPTFQLPADEPYYFGFNLTASSNAPDGLCSLALAETINGQSFSGSIVIFIEPPGSA